LFEVTSGEDAPPHYRLPLPPQTPPACSRQERTRLSDRQRSARIRGSNAELANLGLSPQDCTVGTALAFCVNATNEVDRDASMLSCSSRRTTCTHTRARTHTLTCIHTHVHRRTHSHRRTHAQTHAHTRAHTHTHTLSLSNTLAYTRTHTHTHTHKHTL
jgi:hypothetical protein